MQAEKNKKNKAQAMVIVFVYISVISLVAIYMMSYAGNLHNVVLREYAYIRGLNAGESALTMAMIRLANGAGNPANFTTNTGIGVTYQFANIGTNVTRIRATVSNWQP